MLKGVFSGSKDYSVLYGGCCVNSPVQFVMQLQSQLLIDPDHLYVRALDGNGLDMGSLPTEVHHHLLGLGGVKMQMFRPVPSQRMNGWIKALKALLRSKNMILTVPLSLSR